MTETKAGNRIEWCDIFKGLLILLVVVIHTTYEFNHYLNQYAYQFGMQALFFISGYTSKARNQSLFEEIFKKFYKLVVPYYFLNFIGVSLFWILDRFGVLPNVSGTQYPANFGFALKAMFSSNNIIYCDWLGAMWFLPTLFLATILFKALAVIFKKDLFLMLSSIAVFFVSTEMLLPRGIHSYFLDLAGIAQVFMVFGYLTQKIKMRENSTLQLTGKIILIGFIWWISVRLGFCYTVEFPERHFNGAVDLILPLCGTLLTINLAKLAAKSHFIKKPLIYLGRNSMGIMCFHLIGFKIAYLFLILLGRMEIQEAYHLIPWPELKNWWIPITTISIIFSILLWNGLNHIPFIRLLLGGGNPSKAYRWLQSTNTAQHLSKYFTVMTSIIQKNIIRYRYILLSCCLLVLIGSGGRFLYQHSGEINITFPYKGNSVIFQEGWFAQNNDEAYRWFSEQAKLKVFLTNQKHLVIKGYIPEGIDNISYLSVKLNQTELYHSPVAEGTLIEISLDISKYVSSYRNNILEITTDGHRIPTLSDVDQRALSANVSSILIY